MTNLAYENALDIIFSMLLNLLLAKKKTILLCLILFFLIVFKKALAILKPKKTELVLVLAIPTGATRK